MLALGALFGSASASAATQHWYGQVGGAKLSESAPTEVVIEDKGTVSLQFNAGGAELNIDCRSTEAAGVIENPSGGASGALGGVTLTFGECAVASPAACVVSDTFKTNALKGEATKFEGVPAIKYSAASESTIITLMVSGDSCPSFWKGAKTLAGSFMTVYQGTGGNYGVSKSSSTNLTWGGQPVAMIGDQAISSKSGKAVALVTDPLPAGEHWYLGGGPTEGAKTKLAEGSSVSYSSSTGSASYTVSSTISGVKFTIQCNGSGNWAGGSVENPAGGGAGTAKGSMVFAGCIVSQPANCVVEGGGASSKSLTGLATEAGGVPAASFSPTEGSTIATFTIGGASCPAALKGGKSLTGGLTGVPNSSGTYAFSGAGLKYAGQTATLSGQATPETSAGERLLLAP